MKNELFHFEEDLKFKCIRWYEKEEDGTETCREAIISTVNRYYIIVNNLLGGAYHIYAQEITEGKKWFKTFDEEYCLSKDKKESGSF